MAVRNSDGDLVEGLGRKSKSILCLLALAKDFATTRERAAGLVWSDRSETQARSSLRQELAQIRRQCGAKTIGANKQSIWLVPELVSIDVQKFHEAIKLDTSEALETAGLLYSGAFMDGHQSKSDSFEDWMETERRTLENRAHDVMIWLAQSYRDKCQYKHAANWAEQAIRIDPLSETSNFITIEALALSKFRSWETVLEAELGVEPADATKALGAQLVSDNFPTTKSLAIVPPAKPSKLDDLFKGRAAVAVLPFRCSGQTPDDVFFADGITEDVVNGLAVWRWFPVIGRYSTNHFRETDEAQKNILNETGARYVIDGSVRRSGTKLRITAELCDAGTGQLLWSRRFEGAGQDVFRIQDDISDEIARRVEPEIRRAETKRLYRQKPSELSIWELLHKARVTKFQNGHAYGAQEDNVTAMAIYREALARDPLSSDAASGIATCHWHNAINSWSSDPAASGAKAMRRAQEAVELDSANYSALATVSAIQTFGQHDIPAAEITARKSLDMNPSDILTRHYLVCSLEFGGKFDEAVEQCEYMMELDPHAPSLSVLCGDLSTCLLLSGNPVEAVEYSKKSMAADPNYSRGRQRLIAALVAAGELAEAKREYSILMTAMPTFDLNYVKRTYPFVKEQHLSAYSGYFAEVGAS
jgi:TolB-like protein/DNA-binding SARP family transcriptional activator